MNLPRLRLHSRLGDTTEIPVRVESDAWSFALITAMSKTAPLRVTAEAHGIPDGWRAAIVDAGGMTELNTAWDELTDSDLRRVTVIDANTVAIDGVCGIGFRNYTTGGALAFRTPRDLSGYTAAKMDLKKQVGGGIELSLTNDNGRLQIDEANHAVWIRLSDTDKAALTARAYVFDIELTRTDGIDALCSPDSTIDFVPEVTTTP